MTPSQATEIIDLLCDRFEDFCPNRERRDDWLRWFTTQKESSAVVLRGISSLVTEWSQRRKPTKPEIQKAIEAATADERRRGTVVECYKRVEEHRKRYGDSFLAMFAKPSDVICQMCESEYVPRGVPEDSHFFGHEHFTIADVDNDSSLDIAIADAKRVAPHPLEALARPKMSRKDVERVIAGVAR